MWFSSFQTKQLEEFKALCRARAEDNQSGDTYSLLQVANKYNGWTAGKERLLCGLPLRLKMELDMQGLSQLAREEYLANLMI